MDKIIENLQRFANEHGIVLQQKGEVGFGRPCVGFTHGDNYINFNPYNKSDYEPINELYDERFDTLSTPNAYHKHDCLAVLVHGEDYDAALTELNEWIVQLEAAGELEVVTFPTGATGIQAMLTGAFGRAIKYTTPAPAPAAGSEQEPQ